MNDPILTELLKELAAGVAELARSNAKAMTFIEAMENLGQIRTRQRSRTPKAILSFREAARLLGIDRSTTLKDWIAEGHIAVVVVKGKKRIPYPEIERIIAEGIPTAPVLVRSRRARTKPEGNLRAEVRKMVKEKLAKRS